MGLSERVRVGTLEEPVHDLVAGSGLEFAERGVEELKGVRGAWRLYRAAG
jgi:hypothetical protein